MKSVIAAKQATANKILTCPHSIFVLYEMLRVGCLEQMAARVLARRIAGNLAKRRDRRKREGDEAVQESVSIAAACFNYPSASRRAKRNHMVLRRDAHPDLWR